MKLTAVNNRQIRQNSTNKINNNPKNVAFKGLTDTLMRTWEIIDSSRGIQFTVEDMLGTNIPRSYSGAMSGYEYTGKINWPYLLQEGIREFLTGPTMTLAPIAILALITKMSGKTASTHKENIVNLSYLAGKLKETELEEKTFRSSFVKEVVKDTLARTISATPEGILTEIEGKDIDSDIDALAELIEKYAIQTKVAPKEKGLKSILSDIAVLFDREKRIAKKDKKAQMQKTLKEAQKKFEDIIKNRKQSYIGTDFKVAKYSIDDNKAGATTFENYVKYIGAYVNDYIDANSNEKGLVNIAKDAITKFRDVWSLKRVGIVGVLIFGTGILMSFIPKLYTLASGGINPGGKAIYDEAAKREGNR